MPPSDDHYQSIRFIYAHNTRRQKRIQRLWLLAWLILPPLAVVIGFVIGYFHIVHRLPGF